MASGSTWACYPISPYKFEGLLGQESTDDQILEALQLWGMPLEAYPPDGLALNYTIKSSQSGLNVGKIHVHLLRQAFVTQPKTEGHSFFSFFNTPEYPIGVVQNPLSIGNNVQHKGYNHSSAVLALGEAKLLAGWEQEVFALEWTQQFDLHRQPDQPFPPILSQFIFVNWPFLSQSLGPNMEPVPEDPDPDEAYPKSTSPSLNAISEQLHKKLWDESCGWDLLHATEYGLAAMRGSEANEDELNQCDEVGEDEQKFDGKKRKLEEVRDEQSCDSSSVCTYEDPELVGPDSEWHIIAKSDI